MIHPFVLGSLYFLVIKSLQFFFLLCLVQVIVYDNMQVTSNKLVWAHALTQNPTSKQAQVPKRR